MQGIVDALKNVRMGDAIVYRNLTVFPLLGDAATAGEYVTLDEALEQKSAVVTEVSEGGSVPELKFVNSGNRSVFLLDGEELIGAKQNRILNLSILVAAGKTVIIPVSCVEAGRWSHRSRHFASAPRAQYAEGRAMKMAQVSASMRSTGKRSSDQSRVWDSISAKSARFAVASETSAMSDIYSKEELHLDDYVKSFPVREGQSGALFAIGGRIVGLELFDSADTLRKLFAKLLRSYGLDALDHARSKPSGEEKPCTHDEANKFLARIAESKSEEFPAIGEGVDLRLSGNNLTGAALAADNRIIHLSAFMTGK
jgi:hypothetical protein